MLARCHGRLHAEPEISLTQNAITGYFPIQWRLVSLAAPGVDTEHYRTVGQIFFVSCPGKETFYQRRDYADRTRVTQPDRLGCR
jgi:hypothetical protein